MSKHICIQSLPCHCNNSLKISSALFLTTILVIFMIINFPPRNIVFSHSQVGILFFIVELHPGYTMEDRIWKRCRFHCHVSGQHVPAVLLRASLPRPHTELLTGLHEGTPQDGRQAERCKVLPTEGETYSIRNAQIQRLGLKHSVAILENKLRLL